jgi:pullulanase-type alpha-1,6-glucosidase
VAGNLQSELGCPGDWQPDCLKTLLKDPDGDDVYTFTANVPEGNWEYKVALNEGWDVAYPGSNKPFTVPAGGASVTFNYNSVTNEVSETVGGGEPPLLVTFPGNYPAAAGLGNDWDPSNEAIKGADDNGDGVYKFVTSAIPAGTYEFKAAVGGSWDESYGINGGPNNVPFTSTGGEVHFYYDRGSGDNFVASRPNYKIPVVAGNLQSELGCPGDWQPDCLKTWMKDPDGDEVYTFTAEVPEGNWEYKVALNESWDTAFPASNRAFTVPAGGATVTFSFDAATNEVSETVVGDVPDEELVQAPAQSPLQDEIFYFLLTDRFANGDPTNDEGAAPGGALAETGFLPTDKAFYHGGDLAGLQGKLDYLAGLGVTSLWITPVFENQPTQPDSSTAFGIGGAYHGYWILDYENADPHLGSNAELQAFIDEAHANDIKVYFDMVVNHTADVISYAEGEYDYRYKADFPYRDADGNEFDDRDYVGGDTFPALDSEISFPYTPLFANAGDSTAKNPMWLNNPIYYHNRGDSTFLGESSTYGDFFGLDDTFTEHPDVVSGYIEIFKNLIDTFDIDGFRIDTVKHVNIELWQQLAPEVMAYAQSLGKDDFGLFGEVFDGNPAVMSLYTTEGDLPSVLDFGLHGAASNFAANGAATDNLTTFFAQDDYYTDADSNAYSLGNFVSNHDGFIERLGGRLRQAQPGADDTELVARMNLGYGLIFFARGFPVIYYGDEQGFVGIGSDKLAREDMLPSLVPDYMDNDLIGTDATPADDNFDATHPIYQALASYAEVYSSHAALRRGAQIQRYSQDSAGIFAFSRIDREEQVEYVVALNNATSDQQATFATYSPDATWTAVYPATKAALRSSPTGAITVDVPALGLVIYKADAAIPASAAAPNVAFTKPAAGGEIFGRAEVAVALDADQLAEVTFAVKVGSGEWEVIGVDTNAPYRVFYDVSALPVGTSLSFRAIANDLKDHLKSATVSAVVGEETPPVSSTPQYAIIHYYRADGDYGDHTTGDYNDYWGLHLWGDIEETIEWTSPKPFLGETAYGRFAWVKLAPNAQNVGFIIHRGDVKDGTDADRSFNPGQSAEIWLVGGDAVTYTSQAAAQGFVTVHYQRPDGDYGDYTSDDYADFWGLHLWGDAIDPSEGTGWTTPRKPDGEDDYGVYFNILVQDVNQPVNFIVHKGDVKDPADSPDRAFTPADTASIWLMQDDVEVYTQRGAAEGFATLHYHRPAGDYGDFASDDYNDFWGLHTWGGAEDPGWTTPRKPNNQDMFGLVFEVPLFANATQLNYILHRGDEKDPGQDQFLIFADKGYEVWQLQGADPEDPYILPVPQVGGANAGNIGEQRAYWVLDDTIAWAAAESSANTYKLCYAPEGGLEATDEGVTGGECLTLTRDPAGLPDEVKEKFPHLADLPALKIAAAELDMVPDILRGQIAVSAVNAEGLAQDATGLQIPGVLDDLYVYGGELGVGWEGDTPVIRLWAPTAKSVRLHLFPNSIPATEGIAYDMYFTPDSGVWTLKGEPNWKNQFYLYEVEVYVHATGQVEHNMVTDPYSFSLSTNSARTQIVNLNDPALAPAGWESVAKPPLAAPEDISVYEIHVRDFSVSDPAVPAELKGTFKAFTLPDSNGVHHLKALAEAGVTHLHLLPVFDIATIDEDKNTWQSPAFTDLAAFPPDSEEQQALVEATRSVDPFNWGYDPWHYTAPEGSYATNPDGSTRIVEFREMVEAINGMGLRVVMDVVYNHTNAAGQSAKSVLDRIVPGYYHRLNDRGAVETSTCCQNTATEHTMMEKLMIDSVLTWATEYKVDAFRFDLMGHHMKRNMLKLREALDALTLENDGVDGKSIYVYGEGWNFGEVQDGRRGENATQLNMAGTGIGTFSDRLRDAVRGGGPFDGGQDLVRRQGFANGLYFDPNALNSGSEAEKDTLLLLSDQIRVGLAGNLADYEFIDRNGDLVKGSQVDYNGQPAGYTQDPQENITYISKHDNQTLYDINAYKTPVDTSMVDRVRLQQVGLSIVALGQGVHFFHAGSDLLRSKSMDRDSYDSGDWFNRLDFTYQETGWGAGLPVARVNQDNWTIMQPLLADPALNPAPADIAQSAAVFQEWMAIRTSSPLFSLETEADIQARLAFHNTGPDQLPGLIVMSLSDMVEPDLDKRAEFIVALFNANDEAQTFVEPATIGMDLTLHPVQVQSVDAVVKTATFDPATGAFTVPARTTAVFVLPVEPTVPRSQRFNLAMDTFIYGAQPAEVFGAASTMWVGHNDQMRSVVQAEIEGIPADSAVDKAYLYVYVTEGRGFNNWTDSTLDVSIHAVQTPWDEATAHWTAPWAAPGGDFGPALDTLQIGSARVGTWWRFDVTDAVAAMVAGMADNNGFLMTSEHVIAPRFISPDGLAQTRYGLATQSYWDPSKVGYLRVMYRTYE